MKAKNTLLTTLLSCFLFSFLMFSSHQAMAEEILLDSQPPSKPFRIAMFYPRDAPFWTSFINLMQAAANDLGIELLTFSAQGNRLLMKQQFLSVLDGKNKVDAVVFNNYKDSASQFIKLANDAKVFSFLVNSAMTEERYREMGKPREKYPFWIGQMLPDEVGANQKITNILIDEAKLISKSSTINVVGVNGPISSGAAIMRFNALKETLKFHENVNLLQVVNSESWNEEEASLKFQALMKRYKKATVVWAGSARLVDGILQGEKQLNLKAGQDYFTGGIGFKQSMLNAIANGQVCATAGGHYIEGAWALVLLYDYLTGIDFMEHGVELLTPMGLVTKDNIALYLDNLIAEKWTSSNLKKIDFRRYSKVYNPRMEQYDFDFDSIVLQLY